MEGKEAAVGSVSAAPATDRGWCLCLSGGGFRANLFHLGVVERLNELGAKHHFVERSAPTHRSTERELDGSGDGTTRNENVQ